MKVRIPFYPETVYYKYRLQFLSITYSLQMTARYFRTVSPLIHSFIFLLFSYLLVFVTSIHLFINRKL